jgi:UDP-N-acetylglucosamine 3-dehydrogenase
MSELRLAVIGAGRMGTNHVRVLSEMENVRLAAVCDANREAAEKVARRYLVPAVYTDIDELAGREGLEAAVIAVPTAEHLAAAEKCISRGLHVLIEKPLASSGEQCAEILEKAKAAGVQVLAGHIERFNPVVLQLKQFLDEKFLGTIFYIETVRSGPFPKRLYGSKDGVVIDLAVHDLDLIHFLFGRLEQVYAHHIQTASHKQDIYARVMLKTRTGVLGSSEFSWISPRKERSISIYGDKGLLVGNLTDQEVWFYENGDVGIDYSDNYYQNVIWGRVSEGKVVKFPTKKEEPLRKELEYFCRLSRGEVRGYDPIYGQLAVEYSQAVLDSGRSGQVIRFDSERSNSK